MAAIACLCQLAEGFRKTVATLGIDRPPEIRKGRSALLFDELGERELLDRGMQSRRCAYESSISSNVSADDSAGMSDRGSRHAAACDHGPTWTASEPNQRCYFIRLLKRRERHGVRRCCERQRKGNSDQPDHSSLPCEPFKKEGAKAGHQCSGFGKVPARPGRRIACPPRSRRSEGALTKIEGANSAMAVGTLRR
jgi:hypothetical protein